MRVLCMWADVSLADHLNWPSVRMSKKCCPVCLCPARLASLSCPLSLPFAHGFESLSVPGSFDMCSVCQSSQVQDEAMENHASCFGWQPAISAPATGISTTGPHATFFLCNCDQTRQMQSSLAPHGTNRRRQQERFKLHPAGIALLTANPAQCWPDNRLDHRRVRCPNQRQK